MNAWFMNAFARGKLKDFLGEYRDFLNYVPTSFNTVMDIFLTHSTRVDDVDVLHKFTCIELKTGICNRDNLEQIVKYENWLTRKPNTLSFSEKSMRWSVRRRSDLDR